MRRFRRRTRQCCKRIDSHAIRSSHRWKFQCAHEQQSRKRGIARVQYEQLAVHPVPSCVAGTRRLRHGRRSHETRAGAGGDDRVAGDGPGPVESARFRPLARRDADPVPDGWLAIRRHAAFRACQRRASVKAERAWLEFEIVADAPGSRPTSAGCLAQGRFASLTTFHARSEDETSITIPGYPRLDCEFTGARAALSRCVRTSPLNATRATPGSAPTAGSCARSTRTRSSVPTSR